MRKTTKKLILIFKKMFDNFIYSKILNSYIKTNRICTHAFTHSLALQKLDNILLLLDNILLREGKTFYFTR